MTGDDAARILNVQLALVHDRLDAEDQQRAERPVFPPDSREPSQRLADDIRRLTEPIRARDTPRFLAGGRVGHAIGRFRARH